MIVAAHEIQIAYTVGSDGARQILSTSGMTPTEVADAIRSRGPHNSLPLPQTVAGLLFELKKGEDKLSASAVGELSDGMEIIFTLTYPRPAAGELDVRVNYYESVPNLRSGSFTAYDEQGPFLGSALLSRASVTTKIFLPEIKSAETASVTNAVDQTASSQPAAVAATLPPPVSRPSFGQFFQLGVEHILTGFDHLLFLAALLIGIRKPAAMLGVITCFTLAHSVTLALAALNVVVISSRIVEPLIAVSIIVVCVENLVRKNAVADRFWLAGGFGLIHGFGFAAALREAGLGQGTAMAMPLFSFNLGVESGQLAVAAVFLPVLFLMRRWPGFVRYGTLAISTAVIFVSGYWLLERTVLFK